LGENLGAKTTVYGAIKKRREGKVGKVGAGDPAGKVGDRSGFFCEVVVKRVAQTLHSGKESSSQR